MTKLNSFFVFISMFLASQSHACKWYETPDSYQLYKVHVGFVGKLYERANSAEVVDEERLWAKFEPVFVIHGQWNRLQKLHFPDTARNYELIEGFYYLVHADEEGRFVEPCNYNLGLTKFTSTDEESFKRFIDSVRSSSTELRWNGEIKK